ncbi:MAG: ABC transporter permease subunit [Chloroflexota bacterium]
MLFMLAALQGIDGAMYEAANVDGASRFQRFRFITLPLLTLRPFSSQPFC